MVNLVNKAEVVSLLRKALYEVMHMNGREAFLQTSLTAYGC